MAPGPDGRPTGLAMIIGNVLVGVYVCLCARTTVCLFVSGPSSLAQTAE